MDEMTLVQFVILRGYDVIAMLMVDMQMLLQWSIYNSIAQFRLEHHLGEIVSIVCIHDPRAKWKIQYVIPPRILPLISDDNKLGIGKKFLTTVL